MKETPLLVPLTLINSCKRQMAQPAGLEAEVVVPKAWGPRAPAVLHNLKLKLKLMLAVLPLPLPRTLGRAERKRAWMMTMAPTTRKSNKERQTGFLREASLLQRWQTTSTRNP